MKSPWAPVLSALYFGLTALVSPPVTALGEDGIGPARHDARNPIVQIFGGERLDLWSLTAPRRLSPPLSKGSSITRNPIDHFILASLEAAGLEMSPQADRRTLARRVFYTLHGLPPTPEEMTQFLNDSAPDAYERLVDRLLDSPRYGEHIARQWLDVVRYSDSNGFDWDEFRPAAWRFRDYVIRSFNADKPFNQFIREQLAGDELFDGAPRTIEERDALIATGFLRLGPHDNSAPLFNEQARSRAELLFDLVDTTGSAFLGLTLSCCRCHDHKTDPLSQADYFRLRAFFEAVKFADETPIDLAREQAQIRSHNAELEAQIAPLASQRDAITGSARERLLEARLAALAPDQKALIEANPDELSPERKEERDAVEKRITPNDAEILDALTSEEKQISEKLSLDIASLQKKKRKFITGLLMTDGEGDPPPTRILFQGDYQQERETVQPGFISVLDPNPASLAKPVNSKTTGRRLTLANWIASPDNPFTARVFVNRAWQAHFGRGLVSTPNDFGLAGARPSHPELLDWLANEFVTSGWSVKKLHKLIVTSAAFQQSSIQPPDPHPRLLFIGRRAARAAASRDFQNQLLWRQNPRRLSAEQLRDSLLAVSGQLRHAFGEPPIWPELPRELLTSNPAFLDDNETKTKGWYPSPRADRAVRTIFLVQKRTVRIPFLETFDLPENATSCARRTESTVAPQALALLNGEFSNDTARHFARRVSAETSEPAEQARRAFNLAFQRNPSASEADECSGFLKKNGLVQLCRVLLNANEFVYLD